MELDAKTMKRRSWIKNIAIIFLAVMLLLTFFSNTFMNYSLPEVSAQYCYGGQITSRVRGSGTIEANQNYQLTASEGRTVKEVNVRNNTYVEKGDVLFTLQENKTDAVLEAMQQLVSLKEERNGYLAKLSPDYADQLKAIKLAQQALSDAQQKKAALTSSGDAVTVDGLTKEQVENKIASLNKLKTRISQQRALVEAQLSPNTSLNNIYKYSDMSLTELNTLLESAESDSKLSKSEYDTSKNDADSLEAALQHAQTAKDDAQNALNTFTQRVESGISVVTKEQLDNAREELEQAEKTYARNKEDEVFAYNELMRDQQSVAEAWQKAQNALREANDAYQKAGARWAEAQKEYDPSSEEYQNAAAAWHDAQSAYISAQETYNAAYRTYLQANENCTKNMMAYNRTREDRDIAIEKQRADYAELEQLYAASGNVTAQKEQLQQAVYDAEDKVTAAEKALKAATISSENAKQKYELANDVVVLIKLAAFDLDTDNVEEQIESYNKMLSRFPSGDTGGMTLEEIEREISNCRDTLNEAQKALAKMKEQASQDSEIAEIQLQVVDEKIEAKEQEIEKLKNSKSNDVITAPVSGQISGITVSPGSIFSQGDTLAEIQLSDRGYSIKFSVTVDQAKRIREGDEATFSYWWGSDMTAAVLSIKPDPSNPQQNRIVTLDVQGDNVSVGSTVNFSIGEKAQNYDCVVPNSAIREDNNGKFVLVVDARSTPLGTRYKARRVDVTVVASDDTSTAIAGAESGIYVITTASKPINAGTQVRLVEN